MRKKGALVDRLCVFGGAAAICSFCSRNNNKNADDQTKPLINNAIATTQQVKLKDLVIAPPTLALHLKPKMVLLRVSMHCNGCARKVEKHISKLEGVSSYEIDLETKMVVVTGDIVPIEVLESVSKVKYAELWDNQSS